MKAGFTLAALLLDDRALARVAAALPPQLLPELRAELASTRGQDRELADLLRALQPELTVAGVGQLPPRAQALLARLLPPGVRNTLRPEAPAARPDFALDEPLLRVLVRLARRQLDEVPP